MRSSEGRAGRVAGRGQSRATSSRASSAGRVDARAAARGWPPRASSIRHSSSSSTLAARRSDDRPWDGDARRVEQPAQARVPERQASSSSSSSARKKQLRTRISTQLRYSCPAPGGTRTTCRAETARCRPGRRAALTRTRRSRARRSRDRATGSRNGGTRGRSHHRARGDEHVGGVAARVLVIDHGKSSRPCRCDSRRASRGGTPRPFDGGTRSPDRERVDQRSTRVAIGRSPRWPPSCPERREVADLEVAEQVLAVEEDRIVCRACSLEVR